MPASGGSLRAFVSGPTSAGRDEPGPTPGTAVTLWGRLYAGQRWVIPRLRVRPASAGRDEPGPTPGSAVTLWGRLYAGQRWVIPRLRVRPTSAGRDEPGPTPFHRGCRATRHPSTAPPGSGCG